MRVSYIFVILQPTVINEEYDRVVDHIRNIPEIEEDDSDVDSAGALEEKRVSEGAVKSRSISETRLQRSRSGSVASKRTTQQSTQEPSSKKSRQTPSVSKEPSEATSKAESKSSKKGAKDETAKKD